MDLRYQQDEQEYILDETETEEEDDDEESQLSIYENSDAASPPAKKQRKNAKKQKTNTQGANRTTAFKRRVAKKVNDFVFDEAEVGDETDDETIPYENDTDFVVDENVPNSTPPRRTEHRRAINRLIGMENEEELEKYLKNRFSSTDKNYTEEEIDPELSQQKLLPTTSDPHLFFLKCRGDPYETLLLLMRKFITTESYGIKSVIVTPGASNYIYFEAIKSGFVKDFASEIRSLEYGLNNVMIVPTNEMPDVLKVRNEAKTTLSKGSWVRFIRGKYRDDIGYVVYVNEKEKTISVKLVPRIDYDGLKLLFQFMNKKADDGLTDEELKRRAKRRPPQKLFDKGVLNDCGVNITRDGDFYTMNGSKYTEDGYLYKTASYSMVKTFGVEPTFEELKLFDKLIEIDNDGTPVVNVNNIIEPEQIDYNVGDRIQIISGELKNLVGVIKKISKNNITMLPEHKDLTDVIEFNVKEIGYFHRMGDHVIITWGPNKNVSGFITLATDEKVILISDNDFTEITVLPEHVKPSTSLTNSFDSSGLYQWGDLVKLGVNEVGVITKICENNYTVLHMNGKIVNLKSNQFSRHNRNGQPCAVDSNGNSLHINCTVSVIGGTDYVGMRGKIHNMYRSRIFIRDVMNTIFVCASLNVQLDNGVVNTDSRYGDKIIAHNREVVSNQQIYRKNLDLLGKTIKMKKGPYKCYCGTIKNVATTGVLTVDLYTGGTINVKQENVIIIPDKIISNSATPSATPNIQFYSTTPTRAAHQTPLYDASGSNTPFYEGSNTPHYSGGEAWRCGPADASSPYSAGLYSPGSPTPQPTEDNNDEKFSDTMYTPSTPAYSTSRGDTYGDLAQYSTGTSSVTSDQKSNASYHPSDGTLSPNSPFVRSTPSSSVLSPTYSETSNVEISDKLSIDKLSTGMCVYVQTIQNKKEMGIVTKIKQYEIIPEVNIILTENNANITINADDIERSLFTVEPNCGDSVTVISGDRQGQPAKLIQSKSIYENVVKFDDEICLFDKRLLCKIITPKDNDA